MKNNINAEERAGGAGMTLPDELKPIDFNLTETNQNFAKNSRFNNNPVRQDFQSKDNFFQPHVSNLGANNAKQDPLRASVLQDSDQEYQKKRGLVTSVLQKMEKGNLYQKANDLIDAAVFMFSKQIDQDAEKALYDFKQLILSFDDRLKLDKLESIVKEAFTQIGQNNTKGLHDNLRQLERVFISEMYDFLPIYLNQFKTAKFGGTGSNNPAASKLQEPIELAKLKQDNEKLKKDVMFLKEQKQSLEKLLE